MRKERYNLGHTMNKKVKTKLKKIAKQRKQTELEFLESLILAYPAYLYEHSN